MKDFALSSESVTAGHPDKLCDRISDAVVDAFLASEAPQPFVNAECAIAGGIVFLAAQFRSEPPLDLGNLARRVIRSAGYTHGSFQIDNCTVMTSLSQLPEIDVRWLQLDTLTDEDLNALSAGHQVTVFGYACRQTPNLMPLPIVLAHGLAHRLDEARESGALDYLSPDGQSQVLVAYRDREPVRIDAVTVTTGLWPNRLPSHQRLEEDIREAVIAPLFQDAALKPDKETTILVNPREGQGEGGPSSHAGLTGRKLGIDGYGGFVRQSGAALCGKGPSRIDRTASYAARWAAKTVVAAGLAEECEVQLSYAIGRSAPISLEADSFGSGQIEDARIAEALRQVFDFRVGAIARDLGLWALPSRHGGHFFERLAYYGQFGREELAAPWEGTEKATALKEAAD